MAIFHFRRKLTRREALPAIGAGVAAGVAVAYLVQNLLRRTSVRSDATEQIPPAHATGTALIISPSDPRRRR